MKKIKALLFILALLCTPIVTASSLYGYVYTEPGEPLFVTTEDGERVVAIDQYTYQIQQGNCWYVENVYPIDSTDTTYDIVLDAIGMTKQFSAFPTLWAVSNDYVTISLGTATGISGGTELTPINRLSGASSREVEAYINPTLTGESFPSLDTILVGVSGTPQNSGGGSSFGRLPIVLDNDTIYVFRIKNTSGNDMLLYSDIIWFEIE